MTAHDNTSARMRKRSITLHGHRTSVCLEEAFWDVLEARAKRDNITLITLIAHVDDARGAAPLASSLRVYALRAR